MATSDKPQDDGIEQVVREAGAQVFRGREDDVLDRVYRAAIGELFDNTADIPQMIKWREIYDHLEAAVDMGEDVANVLEGIVLKNA